MYRKLNNQKLKEEDSTNRNKKRLEKAERLREQEVEREIKSKQYHRSKTKFKNAERIKDQELERKSKSKPSYRSKTEEKARKN